LCWLVILIRVHLSIPSLLICPYFIMLIFKQEYALKRKSPRPSRASMRRPGSRVVSYPSSLLKELPCSERAALGGQLVGVGRVVRGPMRPDLALHRERVVPVDVRDSPRARVEQPGVERPALVGRVRPVLAVHAPAVDVPPPARQHLCIAALNAPVRQAVQLRARTDDPAAVPACLGHLSERLQRRVLVEERQLQLHPHDVRMVLFRRRRRVDHRRRAGRCYNRRRHRRRSRLVLVRERARERFTAVQVDRRAGARRVLLLLVGDALHAGVIVAEVGAAGSRLGDRVVAGLEQALAAIAVAGAVLHDRVVDLEVEAAAVVAGHEVLADDDLGRRLAVLGLVVRELDVGRMGHVLVLHHPDRRLAVERDRELAVTVVERRWLVGGVGDVASRLEVVLLAVVVDARGNGLTGVETFSVVAERHGRGRHLHAVGRDVVGQGGSRQDQECRDREDRGQDEPSHCSSTSWVGLVRSSKEADRNDKNRAPPRKLSIRQLSQIYYHKSISFSR
jgi:hypothetical protein